MQGEDNFIDFKFEDLEFIDGDIEQLADDKGSQEAKKEDTTKPIEGKDESAAAAEPTGEAQKAAQKTEDNKTAIEDPKKGTERVDGSTDGDSEGKETSPQLYHTLANVLKEQGVFSSVDESSIKDVNDVKTLVNVIKEQIKAEEFSDLSDQQKIVLNDMRAGVAPTTASKFKNAMDQLDGITDETIAENKQARFDLIYQDFISKGFTQEKAQKFANRSFEIGEDKVDALEAKDSLKRAVKGQYDKAKQSELDVEVENKKKIAESKDALKERILKSPEVMDGVEVNEGLRHEIFDVMNNIVSSNPKTGVPENALMKYQRENPVEFSHKLYYLYKVTNGFEDLGYFGRRKESSSVKQLESALRQSSHVSGGGNPDFTDDNNSSLLDMVDIVAPGE